MSNFRTTMTRCHTHIHTQCTRLRIYSHQGKGNSGTEPLDGEDHPHQEAQDVQQVPGSSLISQQLLTPSASLSH